MRNRLAPTPASLMTRRTGRRNRRSGYVLLAVLAVLVLMITALTTLSKLSLRRALAAADAQMRLRQRVGADSIEAVLLNRAGSIFDQFEKRAEEVQTSTSGRIPIPKSLRDAVTLNGITFDVVVSDEDAKLNVNQVYHLAGPQKTASSIGDLMGPAGAQSIRLLPAVRPMESELLRSTSRPESGDDDDGEEIEIPRAFRSWGEIFDIPALSAGFGSDAALPNLTGEITCWGGGGLNIRRASDGAIRAAAACVLSKAGADRLTSRYKENPTLPLDILIQREANTETERRRLRTMLGDSSSHFSLWIDASAVARKSLRTFSVMRKSEDGTTINERFSF